MNISFWIIIIAFFAFMLLFCSGIVALIASIITRKNGRDEATDIASSALKESSHDIEEKSRILLIISNSSPISKSLFSLFENLTISSLAVLGLGAILVLLSAFFIGI